jgi:hypothetical protein
MPGVCTMSWLRDEGGYDLFFNRDEKRSRLAAEPPSERRVGSTTVLAPRDGEAGGSWVVVNEHGLTLALLNGYLGADAATTPSSGQWTSRGRLVMDLSDCSGVAELMERLKTQDLTTFRSFHLAAFDPRTASLASWQDGALECVDENGFSAPLISSSFRFEEVAESRGGRYREFIEAAAGARLEGSLAYHRSHVPERGPFSPCMHREDARTVSFTWVHVGASSVQMRYTPDAPCRGWPPGGALALDRSEPGSLPLAGR